MYQKYSKYFSLLSNQHLNMLLILQFSYKSKIFTLLFKLKILQINLYKYIKNILHKISFTICKNELLNKN